jgi:hypothetical protein
MWPILRFLSHDLSGGIEEHYKSYHSEQPVRRRRIRTKKNSGALVRQRTIPTALTSPTSGGRSVGLGRIIRKSKIIMMEGKQVLYNILPRFVVQLT